MGIRQLLLPFETCHMSKIYLKFFFGGFRYVVNIGDHILLAIQCS